MTAFSVMKPFDVVEDIRLCFLAGFVGLSPATSFHRFPTFLCIAIDNRCLPHAKWFQLLISMDFNRFTIISDRETVAKPLRRDPREGLNN